MFQQSYGKAEPYLLRSMKASELAFAPDDFRVGMSVSSLCVLYTSWNKPDKSEPCYHRVIGMIEKQYGASNPVLEPALTSDAQALRLLGRVDEATQVEQRIASIHKAAKPN